MKRGLEQLISNIYINNNILCPSDLTIENISKAYGVEVVYRQSKPRSFIKPIKIILLDNRVSKLEQYEDFLHELAHFVLEDEMLIKYNFSKYKFYEQRKNNIVKYLAVPGHMLKYFKITSSNLLQEISELFHIGYPLTLEVISYLSNIAINA